MKHFILLLVLTGIFFSECRKKDSAPVPTKTKEEYLTAHRWSISDAVTDVPTDVDNDDATPPTTDIWSVYFICDKKIDLIFLSDGTGTQINTYSGCGSTSAFNWTLSDSELTLNYVNSSGQIITSSTLPISVDDNTLKLIMPSFADSDGVIYVETKIFSKSI